MCIRDRVGAVQLYSSELTVIQGYLASNSVICLFSASTVSCATPGRSTPTEMVTGLWATPVLWAVDVSVGAAPAMVAPGVLVAELQALTMTMAAESVASVLNLPWCLAAISSLTSRLSLLCLIHISEPTRPY